MDTIITTSIKIQKLLLTQAATIAQELNISQDRLLEIAIDRFIREQQNEQIISETSGSNEPTAIHQGDIYWVQMDDTDGIASTIPHPYVVIQETVLNQSRINTVVVCALTSNIQRANSPGNVLLEIGEANLTKQSVIEVSKVSTIAKKQLGDHIGTLNEKRIHQILAGMQFLQSSFYPR